MDHDRHPEALLVPFGVREVSRGKAAINPLNILFGQSRETSDFIADALQRWWSSRRPSPPDIRKRMIELDHGPEISGVRTPFLKRLVEFSHASQREIERLPFPPYHRKDNPIERCWGVLENHGSGPLLTAIDTALRTAATMTWRGVSPRVDPLTTTYERGGRLTKKLFRDVARKLQRSSTLPQWSLSITPNSA